MEHPVFNTAGEQTQTADISDVVFGIEPNTSVMHQALVRQQANARLGTHQTKTRAQVSGGGKKPWRQKGTGRARQGSTRSPQWRGGGVVFGPHPRSYEQAMPKKMRRLAVRSALSIKLARSQLILVDDWSTVEPKTKLFIGVLDALKLSGVKVLVVVPEKSEAITKAAGNLPNVKVIMASYLNVLDLLRYDYTVMSLGAVRKIEEILG